MHPKIRSRAYDITHLEVFTNLQCNVEVYIRSAQRADDCTDPAESQFIIRRLLLAVQRIQNLDGFFDNPANEFKFREASTHRKKAGGNKYFAFIGDDANLANERAYEILRERGGVELSGMEMEPLEVILEFIRDPKKPYIGGCPQIYKIYTHLNTLPYNIYWPNRASRKLAFGGELSWYERNEFLAMD